MTRSGSWGPTASGRTVVFIGFVILSLVVQTFHEPWRDEAQAWMIARDNSLWSIFHQTGYNGTPALWYLVLYPISHLGLPYAAMGWVHVAIISAAVAIVLRWAPFSLRTSTMLVFSYFFVYEYNALARSYALSVLLLFALAALYHQRLQRPLLFSGLLFLLLQSNVHSVVLGIPVCAIFLLDIVRCREVRSSRRSFLAIGIIGLGLVVAICQLMPPQDLMATTASWKTPQAESLWTLSRATVNAFAPLNSLNPWTEHIVESQRAFFGLAAIVVMVSFWALWRSTDDWRAVVAYGVGYCGLQLLFVLKYEGFRRHHGLLFVAFLCVVWVALSHRGSRPERRPNPRVIEVYLGVVLALQIVSGATAVVADVKRPYSQSSNAADFLLSHGDVGEGVLLATYHSPRLLGVVPYLPEGTRVFRLETRDWGTFATENQELERNRNLSGQVLTRRFAAEFARGGFARGWLLADDPHLGLDPKAFRLTVAFRHSIAAGESVHLFEFEGEPLTAP